MSFQEAIQKILRRTDSVYLLAAINTAQREAANCDEFFTKVFTIVLNQSNEVVATACINWMEDQINELMAIEEAA